VIVVVMVMVMVVSRVQHNFNVLQLPPAGGREVPLISTDTHYLKMLTNLTVR